MVHPDDALSFMLVKTDKNEGRKLRKEKNGNYRYIINYRPTSIKLPRMNAALTNYLTPKNTHLVFRIEL